MTFSCHSPDPEGHPLIADNSARRNRVNCPNNNSDFSGECLGEPPQCLLPASFASRTGEQLVLTDQEENVFSLQRPCSPVPPNRSFSRGALHLGSQTSQGDHRARLSLRKPLLLTSWLTSAACLSLETGSLWLWFREAIAELSGTNTEWRSDSLQRNLVAKIQLCKLDIPG